jgi:hypothetical protein
LFGRRRRRTPFFGMRRRQEEVALFMGSRMSWPEIRQSAEYRGRWVALDNCKYDAKTAQPVEGSVVDADEDLVELCNRIKLCEKCHCAILYCDGESPPPSSRRSAVPPMSH